MSEADNQFPLCSQQSFNQKYEVDMIMKKNNFIIALVILLNFGAFCFAVIIYFNKELNMFAYNMGRALIFSWLSFYLLLKPKKIDFLGTTRISTTENSYSSSAKTATIIAVIVAVLNIINLGSNTLICKRCSRPSVMEPT